MGTFLTFQAHSKGYDSKWSLGVSFSPLFSIAVFQGHMDELGEWTQEMQRGDYFSSDDDKENKEDSAHFFETLMYDGFLKAGYKALDNLFVNGYFGVGTNGASLKFLFGTSNKGNFYVEPSVFMRSYKKDVVVEENIIFDDEKAAVEGFLFLGGLQFGLDYYISENFVLSGGCTLLYGGHPNNPKGFGIIDKIELSYVW